ncbi:hypothetical protein M441DRAFT_175588 [Trichoderma asperellum CBS 433.97]|uniref:Protein NO VEIN C-terminal domain-containing protein n=1 Tax=Trichoderma asperellum (strain ATCC 204424 / CBS 433.97 / NBRC 101777) TaxID=1042311 RepID=A0A2T3YX74_TRIA4|nr:hypothetical protein M441DRAFT_175588 [Trichoderma asperellum CBS 433.97]PTB37137.1 hypothetical protein M441DRAFT_175588 [Trichoderma asperellum CBS 433.97]
MTSLQKAEEIVRRLTRKYGYLNEEMMSDIEKWKPEYRREIDENWLAMENTAAHSIKTLAKQIYGSGARFVFELLQNAEDNIFSKTTEDPFISFKVYENRIIVECNEDGFTERDLVAICAVGQSTKSSSYGYIGAKGIGFKSVFIAAWKVYIQSGNFSFEFRHKKDDPGLGMVRPIWVSTREKLKGPLTRMTLHFHDEGDPDDLQHLKSMIFKQLEDLQQTCLLFLKKLQKIKVTFYDKNERVEKSKEFLKRQVDEYRVALDTSSTKGTKTRNQSQIYHITTLKANELARSDNRDLPNTDEARAISTTAEVVLAFPLSVQFKPLVDTEKKQEIFAFLPVRESDYKFLIHSDFDTSANRQDIITTSKRNENLLCWIAKAFVCAVKEFCKHDTLCYEWPLFLPTTQGASNTFWAELDVQIQEMVTGNPTLRSRRRKELRLITDVFILDSDAVYGKDEPIFDDPVKDPFLSRKYSPRVKRILEDYGLQYFTADDLLALLRTDIHNSNSRMYGTEMTEEWHSAVARLLCSWFDHGFAAANQLKELRLIPLRYGTWTSAARSPVYFPETKGIDIPEKLDIRVLQATAASNVNRKRLFEYLGASEADDAIVRASILRAYTSANIIHLKESMAYLRYLYLTHHPGVSTKTELKNVVVVDGQRNRCRPYQTAVYRPGRTHSLSPESLLAPDEAAPGFSVPFIHSSYMRNAPEKPTSDHPSWETWLSNFVCIREQLPLTTYSGEALSEVVMYVHEHRPEQFLELLKYLWRNARLKVRENQTLRRNIKALPAKDLCRVSYPISLGDTWLPFGNLCGQVSLYMEFPTHFPFLKIDSTGSADTFGFEWSFLTQCFDVRKEENLDFYMQMLCYIQKSHLDVVSALQRQKIFDLYAAIHAKLAVAGNQLEDQLTIKAFFAEARILVPDDESTFWLTDGEVPIWASSSDCLWLAPPDMRSKYSLSSLYSRSLGGDQLEYIGRLFQRIVEIPSASLLDIVAELELLKAEGCDDLQQIDRLYRYLRKITPPIDDLRGVFATKQLIYAKCRGEWRWCNISDCLWSSTVEIRGKVTLDSDYEALKSFFVEMLGVTSLTFQMLYDELKQPSPQSGINDLKVAILSLSSQLQTNLMPLDPQPILDANIFPVRYCNGEVALRSAKVDFAIPDRDYLSIGFKEKIAMLDFDLEDICRLKPFFEWTKLQGRYLSNCVMEGTSVSETGRPILVKNRDLKRKAYYILRIAATFSSPRYLADPSGFYQLLRTMNTMETNRISSTLSVSQNNEQFCVENVIGNEHIECTSSGLTIFVPRKRKPQTICFSSALPRKFAEWIMQDPKMQKSAAVESELVNTLAIVFTCDRSVLNEICDRHGIIQVGVSNEDIEDDEEEQDDSDFEEEHGQIQEQLQEQEQEQEQERRQEQSLRLNNRTLSEGTPSEQLSTTSRSPSPSSTNTSFYETSETPYLRRQGSNSETLAETVIRRSHLSNHSPPVGQRQEDIPSHQQRSILYSGHLSSPDSSLTPVESRENLASSGASDDTQYGVLLERVVATAQSATFPSQGSFDMSDLRNNLPGQLSDDTFESFDGLGIVTRFRSANQLERDKKVGAAGELFVFELLSTLELPRWSNENWQSTIRSYVRAHPNYRNMASWRGRETADLVYDDTEGQLTNTLIGCGYLDQDEWHNARPKYYIEVKTTTGPRETPFYMSNSQYERMRRTHATPDRSEIYMILRVFWLNSDNISMCVYFDPEQLRQDGRLLFTAQTWSVTPTVESED